MSITDMFLKLDKTPGESEDTKHKGEIDVLSWSWGVSNSGSMAVGGGGGSGTASPQDFHFTMLMSSASPLLMDHCNRGTHLDKAVLTCRKAGGDPHEYLILTFEGCLVSSYSTGGGGGGDSLPVESIGINFAKMSQKYVPQSAKGSGQGNVEKGMDYKTKKAS